MSLNRTAKGIVLVPSLLLGGAFIAAAAWVDGPAGENRILALILGGTLVGAGLLAQLLPESRSEVTPQQASMPPSSGGESPSPKG